MQTHKIALTLGALIILACCTRESQTQANVCSGDAGVGIAKAYAIAVSYPDNLPQFVEQNRAFFDTNGTSIRCGRELIAQLRSAALKGPSPDSVREHAADVAGRAGRPDLSGPLADDMLKSRTDMLLLASYLQDLVETLPAIVSGNLEPYHNTSVYQNSQLVWGMVTSSSLMSPQELKTLRDMTMNMSEWYVGNFTASIRIK